MLPWFPSRYQRPILGKCLLLHDHVMAHLPTPLGRKEGGSKGIKVYAN